MDLVSRALVSFLYRIYTRMFLIIGPTYIYIYIDIYIYISLSLSLYICLSHSFSSGPGFQGPGFISVQNIYKDVSDNWSHIYIYIHRHIYIYIGNIGLFHSFSSGPGFQGPGLCWHVILSLIFLWWLGIFHFPKHFEVKETTTWSATVKTLERPGLAAHRLWAQKQSGGT